MSADKKPPRDENREVVEQVDGAELLDQVEGAICAYLVLPNDHAAVAAVLWIAATHAVPAWNTAPRLVIKTPEKRCGKSRLLDLIEALCHRPMMTANDSPTAVYRSIGATPDDPPTPLMDEADTIWASKTATATKTSAACSTPATNEAGPRHTLGRWPAPG